MPNFATFSSWLPYPPATVCPCLDVSLSVSSLTPKVFMGSLEEHPKRNYLAIQIPIPLLFGYFCITEKSSHHISILTWWPWSSYCSSQTTRSRWSYWSTRTRWTRFSSWTNLPSLTRAPSLTWTSPYTIWSRLSGFTSFSRLPFWASFTPGSGRSTWSYAIMLIIFISS